MQKTVVFVLLATILAGCADEGAAPNEEGPRLDVTDDTGGIRGVVVDQAITPVAGAAVRIASLDRETTTDEEGLFTFTGLEPGTYFLETSKLLYDTVQTSVEVQAGNAEPKLVNIRITKLVDAAPYLETHQFEGFYECAFALVFITDQCDMAVRTVHDAGVEPVPRQIQNNVNTAYVTWTDSIVSVVQEGFWNEGATPKMWMMVDSTPIDNGCDCSDYTYVTAQGGAPTYGRADRPAEVNAPANWPVAGEDVAIRGFVPFTDSATEAAYAIDVKFDIFTTFFHNYVPQEGWNIQEKDDYPVPE
ncbi:MAG: carboxypeptidase-like regulatory domain-containing protein [Thermoplasmatota archaeon]